MSSTSDAKNVGCVALFFLANSVALFTLGLLVLESGILIDTEGLSSRKKKDTEGLSVTPDKGVLSQIFLRRNYSFTGNLYSELCLKWKENTDLYLLKRSMVS